MKPTGKTPQQKIKTLTMYLKDEKELANTQREKFKGDKEVIEAIDNKIAKLEHSILNEIDLLTHEIKTEGAGLSEYIVTVDIEICGKTINHYIEVMATSPEHAHEKANKCIFKTLNVLVEKKPLQAV